MNVKVLVSALAVTFGVCGFGAYGQTPVHLTLDKCISIALNENPTIKIADMEITRVDYSKKEVIGQLLPTIDFNGQYSRTLAKQTMYMNMDAFGGMGDDNGAEAQPQSVERSGGNNGIKVGLDNSYSLGFSASLPLIAPQLWKSLKLSDTQILKSVEQARSSRLDMINQVKSAYYSLLLAEDSRKVLQESYDMAALNHEIYSKKYEAGAASDYDVLRTSVAMKNVEPEIIQADIAIKQARLQLLILMGLDADFAFSVEGSLSDYEAGMYETVMLIDPDYSKNSQLVLNDIDTKILDHNVSIQKLSFVPTLALTANYNWTSMNNGTPFSNLRWNPYSSIGVALSIPIFQGGQRYSRLKQAEVQLMEMKWQRENLERSVAMQVNLAIDNIRMNVKQISSSSESVAQAERAHSIMEKSFEIGAASYLDLRDSELALTQARLAYNQSIYNFLVANSELELLLGSAPIEKYEAMDTDL